jgi:hypothetical protein
MSKPSYDEMMAHRFYEAMLLMVAFGSIHVGAMKKALEWAREEHSTSHRGSDDDEDWEVLIEACTRLANRQSSG